MFEFTHVCVHLRARVRASAHECVSLRMFARACVSVYLWVCVRSRVVGVHACACPCVRGLANARVCVRVFFREWATIPDFRRLGKKKIAHKSATNKDSQTYVHKLHTQAFLSENLVRRIYKNQTTQSFRNSCFMWYYRGICRTNVMNAMPLKVFTLKT